MMKKYIKDILEDFTFDKEFRRILVETLLLIGAAYIVFSIGYMLFGPEKGEIIMGDRFILIEDLGDSYVAADKETGVLYMITNDDGITVLLDSDGKPMLYKGKLP